MEHVKLLVKNSELLINNYIYISGIILIEYIFTSLLYSSKKLTINKSYKIIFFLSR